MLRNLNEGFAVPFNDWERWDAIKTRCILRLTCNDREASGVSWAQNFIVKEHTSIQRDTKVRAEVACGIEFTLIPCNQDFLVIFFANFEHFHIAFS